MRQSVCLQRPKQAVQHVELRCDSGPGCGITGALEIERRSLSAERHQMPQNAIQEFHHKCGLIRFIGFQGFGCLKLSARPQPDTAVATPNPL